jgi:hypothetical protein
LRYDSAMPSIGPDQTENYSKDALELNELP